MNIFGEVHINVQFQNISKILCLLIIKDDGPSLLGRDWIFALDAPFFISLRQLSKKVSNTIHSVSEFISSAEINKFLDQFPDLFSPGIGTLKDVKISINVDTSVQPKFCKARPVPYSLKSKVDEALDSLIKDNIITPVRYSKWAAPIVPVLKPNGKIRICGDYKLTANKAILCDSYPLPKPKELLSRLAGGKFFAKLDLSNAYNQLELEDDSKKYTTINTHKGLFEYNRLCFGITCASSIFQRQVEILLHNIDGVLSFSDDILVSGSNKKKFMETLSRVLSILQSNGLKLNREKCIWSMDEITYLGFKVNSQGIAPTSDKVSAIINAPVPKNISELQSFLGLLNFYRNFLPNASTVLEPLNSLLRKGVPWNWNSEQNSAFQKAKELLLQSDFLVHFDPKLPIVVSADSSSYGIGAVLAHIINGKERPVCFASRTLNQAERNYSQIEREALALVYALKQFHFYIFGYEFTLKTDHKPLLGIFSPDKLIPSMASGRIIRWCLTLQAYRFKLIHTSGKLLGHVDALSRLPLPNPCDSVPIPAEWVNVVQFMDSTPTSSRHIASWTKTDPILSRVHQFCNSGWPISNVSSELLPYYRRKNELSLQGDCVLWGTRVVIPQKGRSKLLNDLHSEHVGSTRMKQLARSYFWWPNLDADIEDVTNSCSHCLEHRNNPPVTELHPWMWPDIPWHRVHIDYAGPLHDHYFLIIVDATSKWAEIYKTKRITSEVTINFLRSCFSRFGIPAVLISDNGTSFTSAEFTSYVSSLGIKHITSTVNTPSSNGAAERMVRTFKESLRHFKGEGNLQKALDQFLFKYRITPHSTTGVSPAEIMFGRKIRTIFDLLHPSESLKDRVLSKQFSMKKNFNKRRPRTISFRPNDNVRVRMYGKGPKWQKAFIVKRTGAVTYRCKLLDGVIVHRHTNQIWMDKSSTPKSLDNSDACSDQLPFFDIPDVNIQDDAISIPSSSLSSRNDSSSLESNNIPDDQTDIDTESVSSVGSYRLPSHTRSGRVVRPPDRLDM